MGMKSVTQRIVKLMPNGVNRYEVKQANLWRDSQRDGEGIAIGGFDWTKQSEDDQAEGRSVQQCVVDESHAGNDGRRRGSGDTPDN